MDSTEIKDRKEIGEILESSRTATATGIWEWVCPECLTQHFDSQFTKHGKYRKCGCCGAGVMVVLPY